MFQSRLALKWLVAPAALLAVAAFTFDAADARPGSGRSVGSRGSNTYSAPPATATAPKPAAPITKSMTQPGSATAATAGTAAAASASRFGAGSMMKGLLLGGLMGAAFAGIFGSGALASMLGFLVQTALIVGAVMLIMSFFRRKSQGPAMATAAASASTGPTQQRLDQQLNRNSAGAMGSGPAPLAITGDDFSTFERRLGDIQTAYGRSDQRALGDNMTPEMLSYFVEELTEDSKRGYKNEIGNVKLLQGDLAESWREARQEYATVAMRYSLTDAMIEKSSGNVVNGSRTEPQEVTEVWTFVRPINGKPDQWELSAIQQA